MRHTLLTTGMSLALLACGGPVDEAAPAFPEDAVQVWLTTGDRTRLLVLDRVVRIGTGPADIDAEITVSPATTYQEMVGFGAAITDASAWLIRTRLDPARRDSLMRALFGRDGGAGFSFTRLTIGASDFSRHHYTFDDVPPGETDFPLARFSIEAQRAEVLPTARQALEINPELRVMASPWSAPAWMKTTGSLFGGTLRADAFGAFAEYLRRSVEAYAAEGVPIWAISVQNEPHHEPRDYPGMRLDPAQRARFLANHLGPLFERAGLGTRIFEWDHNWDEPDSPLAVLADSGARRYVDGVAWHCYGGDVSAQGVVHDRHPTIDAYFTECSGGAWAPDFADNLVWNVRTLIVGATRHWARGVLLWNLALDERGGPHLGGCGDCRGVVTIDSRTGAVTFNEEYFALAHASRFVRPGARRIGSSDAVADVANVAFLNPDDGSRVLVVVNGAAAERAVRVREGRRAFGTTIPTRSVMTFVWR